MSNRSFLWLNKKLIHLIFLVTTRLPPCIGQIEEREYISRVSMVITTIFPNILRFLLISCALNSNSPCQMYQQYFVSKLSEFEQFQRKALKKIQKTNTYDSVDIPLSWKLFRKFQLIAPPKKGWGKPPEAHHVTISDDVERIHQLRNEIAHMTDTKINQSTFIKYFKQFSDIGNRVDQHFRSNRYRIKINECITCVMDSAQLIKYENAVKQMENMKCKLYLEHM